MWPGEPKHPAKWRALEIVAASNGTPLFKGPTSAGFIMPGDPIHLLWEIEQAYPALK